MMKKYLLLIAFFIAVDICFAQDKQMLARVAYEDAEKAFEAGKLSSSYEELKKVDEYLGKVMPKTQFLRVQIWKTWAEEDGQYLENAIRNSKTYLAMDKTFDLPEEKMMEVTRWLVKLEKDKVAYDKAEKENALRKAKAVAFLDSLYKVVGYKPDLTEAEFVHQNKEGIKTLKLVPQKQSNVVFYDDKYPKAIGPGAVRFMDNKVTEYTYVLDYHETNVTEVKAKFASIMQRAHSLFLPKDLYISSNKEYMLITTPDAAAPWNITFSYGDSNKISAFGLGPISDKKIQAYIRVKIKNN